jgi:uncharacterized membrane protein YuzA (DUF378 family)
MEMLKRFEPIALLIVVLGSLNWGVLGLTGGDTNVISDIFGTGSLLDVVYVIVGVAGLMFVPRLFEELSHFFGGGAPHPRGT